MHCSIHLEISRLIIENVDDKNPTDEDGGTPLHEAARLSWKDGFEIFRLIMGNVEDKNPVSVYGESPGDYARNMGHRENRDIIQLFDN